MRWLETNELGEAALVSQKIQEQAKARRDAAQERALDQEIEGDQLER